MAGIFERTAGIDFRRVKSRDLLNRDGTKSADSGWTCRSNRKDPSNRCLIDPSMSTRLFTIGYEGAGLQEFLDCLEKNAVECLLDVREVPLSRKRGFSKTPLARALEGRGIRYVHLIELGSPGAIRDELRSGHDYGKFFREMEEYLATQAEGIEQACGYIGRMTCCLMCYEESADTCHRKVVASKIKEHDGNGLEVEHLKLV